MAHAALQRSISHASGSPGDRMRIIRRLLIVAVFVVGSSMSAQDWSSSGGVRWTSDRAGIGGAPASTPQLHVFGPVWVSASHLKVGGASGADLIADTPLGAVSQLLLRSGGLDSVALRREPNTGHFTIRVAGVERMRFQPSGVVSVGANAPGASWFDVVGDPGLSQLYTAGDGVSGGISHSSLAADSNWLGFDVVRNSTVWYMRHSSAAWIAKTNGTLTIKASTGNTVGAIAQPIRDLLTIDLTTGNAHFSGIVTGTEIRATFEDVAEWVPASGNVSAGSVVIVDVEATNGVTASSTPYDTRVAGVVSPQPGIILGKPGPSKVMVATTGRVKVKVDATRGPIRAGDLLVTSDKPGTAMKSEPVSVGGFEMHRPGTLVGKALEPLASGVGEILVLLSLQ
ncbi:MAG TPA: hypothetical protein VHL59_09045 [Thermoanaerobaculia bacterium]|nr:hypothetical protein [Thermoanaerobaculia bacterium]